jgi:hypothetical protein
MRSTPQAGRTERRPSAMGTASMKLTSVTNVSLDGVTQGHRRIDAGPNRDGGGHEENGGGFERFGWGPPLLEDAASIFICQVFQRADAFLFGRRSYEIFAGSWGAGMDPGNPVGQARDPALPRHRPGHRTRAARPAVHPQRAHDPDVPHHRSPAVRDDGHDLTPVTRLPEHPARDGSSS